MLDALNQFLDETRDTRAYKRALAVNMAHEGMAYAVIAAMLAWLRDQESWSVPALHAYL